MAPLPRAADATDDQQARATEIVGKLLISKGMAADLAAKMADDLVRRAVAGEGE
jgi:hypothetical protein